MLRKVEVYAWERKEPTDKHLTKVQRCFATFHQFGSYFEEFESGPGNATGGIIEFEDGHLECVDVSMFIFIKS